MFEWIFRFVVDYADNVYYSDMLGYLASSGKREKKLMMMTLSKEPAKLIQLSIYEIVSILVTMCLPTIVVSYSMRSETTE